MENKGKESEEKESKVIESKKTKETSAKEPKEKDSKKRDSKKEKVKEAKEKKDNEKKNKEEYVKPKKRPLKVILKIIETTITIVLAFISLVIITQKVTNNENAFLGYRIFRVQTGSMIPKYEIGDVILVKETDIDKIKKGDDITYYGTTGLMQGRLVTHQVIDIEIIDGKKTFHTKGIANLAEDPVVYGEQINGVVQSKLYILTTICGMLNNVYVFYFCAILPLTIYIFFIFIKPSRKERQKERE